MKLESLKKYQTENSQLAKVIGGGEWSYNYSRTNVGKNGDTTEVKIDASIYDYCYDI